MQKSTTKNFQETKKLGENLAKEILRGRASQGAMVLALSGDLGAGKTTFLQGFAKGLGIKENILSPTFVIMKKFEIPNYKLQTNSKFEIRNSKFSHFYHFDCYRLSNAQEILSLGFAQIISNPQNIVAIEWPEKIAGVLPKSNIEIAFGHLEENKRELMISK